VELEQRHHDAESVDGVLAAASWVGGVLSGPHLARMPRRVLDTGIPAKRGEAAMTQEEALAYIRECFGYLARFAEVAVQCTGDLATCPVDECEVCSVRECPHRDFLHFHHDGCPACEWQVEVRL
jgi:hypothetical protein